MMRAAGLVLLLGACRMNFEPLGADGVLGDANGATLFDDARGDGAADLGAFGAPMQQSALGTARADQAPSLTNDLLEIYFDSNRSCASCYDVFVAKRASTTAAWGPPAELTELTNAAADMTPEVSPDGLTLWFASERQSAPGGADIWVCTRTSRSQPWGAPVRELDLSTAGYDIDPALSDDGLTMTLTSDGGGTVASDLYISTRASLSAPWSAPVPISELNTPAHESSASLRDGGHLLYFARETTVAQYDIYAATRESPATQFGTPALVGTINSAQTDFDAWVSLDMRTIFFASVRTGDMEIFEATR